LISSATPEPPEISAITHFISTNSVFIEAAESEDAVTSELEQLDSSVTLTSLEKEDDVRPHERREGPPGDRFHPPDRRDDARREENRERENREREEHRRREDDERASHDEKSRPDMPHRDEHRGPRPEHGRPDHSKPERDEKHSGGPKEHSPERPEPMRPGFPMHMPWPGKMMGHGFPPFGGPAASHQGPPMANLIFELLDNNHDAQLSRDEFQKLVQAAERAHHPSSGFPRPLHNGPQEKGDDHREDSHDRMSHSAPMHPAFGKGPGLREARRAKPEHRFDGRPPFHRRPDADRSSRPE
jgi:hypothetical protein